MKNNNSSGGGIGCGTVFLIVFVVLKLVGVIDWSWWWVLSPIWITAGIIVMLVGSYIVVKILEQ